MSENTLHNGRRNIDPIKLSVNLYFYPELPRETGIRKECVIQTSFNGEYSIARYNEASGRWDIPYGAPVDDISNEQVAKWVYLDEIFANPCQILGDRKD